MANSKLADYKLPGRLGDPEMVLGTDPRTNPKLLGALKPFGLDRKAPSSKKPLSISKDELMALFKQNHEMGDAMFGALPNDNPSDENEPKIESTIRTVKGVDGNDIKLYIHRKAGTGGQRLPCVVYVHGGGMAVLSTTNGTHMRWTKSLAVAGVVAINLDFRNVYTAEGYNPFPAGLNDCVAGIKWISEHKAELGIDTLVIQGESGGGNLVCATALQAKKEGWVKSIDGVYANCPFISGGYGWSEEKQLKEIPSAVENAGYMLDPHGCALNVVFYTPKEADQTNPLAWPYHASVEDVKGLPPHFINMDELDLLRDEGIAYARKLEAAGVSVVSTTNLGVTHAASLIFRKALPDLHNATINSIVSFASKVKPATASL